MKVLLWFSILTKNLSSPFLDLCKERKWRCYLPKCEDVGQCQLEALFLFLSIPICGHKTVILVFRSDCVGGEKKSGGGSTDMLCRTKSYRIGRQRRPSKVCWWCPRECVPQWCASINRECKASEFSLASFRCRASVVPSMGTFWGWKARLQSMCIW